jgi:Holliday junction resolvase
MINQLETLLTIYGNSLIKSGRGYFIKNNPVRSYTGKFLKGEDFDFIFWNKNKCFACDAKQTKHSFLSLRDKEIKQINNLYKFALNTGFKAGFIILFEMKHLCFMHVEKLRQSKTINIKDCEKIKNLEDIL